MHCFGSFLLQAMFLSLQVLVFKGKKYEIIREDVVYFHSTLWRRTRPWLELFASTVVDSYHEYHICAHTIFFGDAVALLWDSYTFTRKSVDFFCVLYLPLFGLVQARTWFRSSMWILSVACIFKALCTSEVARATRTSVGMQDILPKILLLKTFYYM